MECGSDCSETLLHQTTPSALYLTGQNAVEQLLQTEGVTVTRGTQSLMSWSSLQCEVIDQSLSPHGEMNRYTLVASS